MQSAFPSDPSRLDAILPPRSRLFALKPHALQTSAVESFTSYLMRLAEAHCVPTGTLIHVAVAPRLQNVFLAQGPSRNVTIFLRAAALLNSHGVSASDWVQALTALTLRTDLPLLTLLPWAQVVSSRQLGRVRQIMNHWLISPQTGSRVVHSKGWHGERAVSRASWGNDGERSVGNR